LASCFSFLSINASTAFIVLQLPIYFERKSLACSVCIQQDWKQDVFDYAGEKFHMNNANSRVRPFGFE